MIHSMLIAVLLTISQPVPPVSPASAREVPSAGVFRGDAPEDPRVAALLAGLQAYESSIVSISWRQAVYAPPSKEQYAATWVLLNESWRYWDAGWSCAIHERHLEADPPDFIPAYRESVMVVDGVRRLSWSVADSHGLLASPDVYPVGGLQLLRALGRSVDFDGAPFTASLSSLLRQAEFLTYLPATAEEPWPGLTGVQVLRHYGVDAQVRLDPAHGMTPRVIRVIRSNDGLVAEDLRVLAVSAHEGVFIPSLCVFGASYAQTVDDIEEPLAAQRKEDLARAMTLDGLPEELHTPGVREAIRTMQAVRVMNANSRRMSGPLTVFDRGGDGILSPQVLVVSDVQLNVSINPDELFTDADRAGQVFDGFSGTFVALREALQTLRPSGLAPLLRPAPGIGLKGEGDE